MLGWSFPSVHQRVQSVFVCCVLRNLGGQEYQELHSEGDSMNSEVRAIPLYECYVSMAMVLLRGASGPVRCVGRSPEVRVMFVLLVVGTGQTG